ncbi:MAG TPA: hypothetical protein VFI04_03135 [Gaiellaceae bacterium]|jgi:hypothetical protein|nr:hypothetical protein [Gaiellaceae bacterium]
MQTRILGAALAAAVLVVTATACGGGGKKASSPPTSGGSAAGTTTTAQAGSTTTAATGGTSFADAKNCTQLASLAAKVQRSVAQTGNGTVAMAREADALKALADAAPDAIKGDFKTFADAFSDFAKVYADSGFKAGTAPTAEQLAKLTDASRKLSTPKVAAAMRHLETWGQTHCRGLTSTTP